ncbi:FeoA family protein [Lunatimonas salinarum]|uniref:FeoA family protein n=1 Tax=Lunatimonas salinarum TaxID=1774590 RepID=UPI001ADFA4C9|nr:FeoA family protein [Lunatimonas salinarum]
MVKTSKIPFGTRYKIREIMESPLSINFLEIGILPGKSLQLIQRAPFGGPLAFLIDDHLIALREEEANLVVLDVDYS